MACSTCLLVDTVNRRKEETKPDREADISKQTAAGTSMSAGAYLYITVSHDTCLNASVDAYIKDMQPRVSVVQLFGMTKPCMK